MKYIELTCCSTHAPLLVDLDSIQAICVREQGPYAGNIFLVIGMDRRGQYGFTVSENYEEVKAKITAAQNVRAF